MNWSELFSNWSKDWHLLWSQVRLLDLIILAVFVFGIFWGLRKGLAKVFPGLISVIVAQITTFHLYVHVTDVIYDVLPVQKAFIEIPVFFCIAFSTFIIVRVIFQLIGLLGKFEFNSLFNSVAGALINSIRFILLFSLIGSFLLLFPVKRIQNFLKQESLTGPFVLPLSQQVHDLAAKWLPGLGTAPEENIEQEDERA